MAKLGRCRFSSRETKAGALVNAPGARNLLAGCDHGPISEVDSNPTVIASPPVIHAVECSDNDVDCKLGRGEDMVELTSRSGRCLAIGEERRHGQAVRG